MAYLCARAFLAHARGDAGAAGRLLDAAARRDPQTVEELIRLNRQRLEFADGQVKQ